MRKWLIIGIWLVGVAEILASSPGVAVGMFTMWIANEIWDSEHHKEK